MPRGSVKLTIVAFCDIKYEKKTTKNIDTLTHVSILRGGTRNFPKEGADSSDGASMLQRGGYSPLALPWRHLCLCLNDRRCGTRVLFLSCGKRPFFGSYNDYSGIET